MIDGPLVFVDVDTQRDFLEPDGALYVDGSDAILGNLARLTAFARGRGIPVLATACSHTENDVEEIAHFGRHCMAGTEGQRRADATFWAGSALLAPSDSPDILFETLPRHLTLEKRDYDVFTHPAADAVVARYNEGRPTFVVYGVATDFCVKAAVIGLLRRGAKVAVVVDAVRAIDRAGEADVFRAFTDGGAVLTLTDVVTG